MRWEELFPEMRRLAPGCPEFILEEGIRDASIDFLMRTDAYKVEEDIQVVANIDEYTLSAPRGFEVNHILQIITGTTELAPTAFEDIRKLQAAGNASNPMYYGGPDNTAFYLAPVPRENLTLKAIYSLKPLRTASSIPDTIGLEYKDAIVAGAAARVLVQPGVAWTDADRAIYFERKYSRESARVQRVVKFGFGGASLRVNYRQFGY